jgi:tRNA pseudouridine32 synthase / 23S rRNA pseudouridine746 synthase
MFEPFQLMQNMPTYWYEGYCPQTGELLRLPRARLVETIARDLMRQLAGDDREAGEGKMYGVLLVETTDGQQQVLKAFSGLLNGQSLVEGWVPPIPGREQVALEEAQTLAKLAAIKQELIALQQIPERQQYENLSQEFDLQLKSLNQNHQKSKQERQQKRQKFINVLTGEALAIALENLNEESRRDGIDRRRFKQQREAILKPLQYKIGQADTRIGELKQQRKTLSRQLQSQMHAAAWVTNFWGESIALKNLMPNGTMPTGTGDCCAPKLLHYAATHRLKPLAMAEFWWGGSSPNGDKVQGEFYGACVERCQPMMGFLLSGLPQYISKGRDSSLPILYEDEWLIAVNKPAGLLSVPGRYHDRQDCVLHRLRHSFDEIHGVHRLDQETSGVLLFARDRLTHQQLSQQFQQRQIHKVYEAVLGNVISIESGIIDLPLWGNPDDRPRQTVDWQHGKPSITYFRVIGKTMNQTRVEFYPITGRTHQIRVHAADVKGLGVPILGDRLYGCAVGSDRLHLHARELRFHHPHTQQTIHLKTEALF